jgi:hypothetical protein
MIIKLSDRYDDRLIADLVSMSRHVAHATGSPRWRAPLRQITESLAHIPTTADIGALSAGGYRGMCWPTIGQIWVSPQDNPIEEAKLFAHEVAHLLWWRADRVHGAEWRRLYVQLAGLWVYGLYGEYPNPITVAWQVISKYKSGGRKLTPSAAAELVTLSALAETNWPKIVHDFETKLTRLPVTMITTPSASA